VSGNFKATSGAAGSVGEVGIMGTPAFIRATLKDLLTRTPDR